MSNVAVLKHEDQNPAEIMEQVIVKGDLSKLTAEERGTYYMRVCDSIGLNPLTKPFEYITLNGKLTLYALRACTDQLRSIHKVSVLEMTETEREGVFIVTAKVANGDGRTDIAKGAVTISNLKGDALANAMMKAETKAKRRATLSICGLGFLDETEIETIPARQVPLQPSSPEPDGPISFEQIAELQTLVVETGADIQKFCAYLKVRAIPEIPAAKFKEAKAALEKKRSVK